MTEESSENNKGRICIEQVLLGTSQMFLNHEPIHAMFVESLRNESRQLLTSQTVQDSVVLTQEELLDLEKSEMVDSSDSEKNSGQKNEEFVHIVMVLDPVRLLPKESNNFFGSRFIDKDSPIVVYVKVDLGVSYFKAIDDSSVHVQVFQPSRLNDDSSTVKQKGFKVFGGLRFMKKRKDNKREPEDDANDSVPLFKLATQMNQDRNDFGLSLMLQSAIIRFLKSYSRFSALFDDIVRSNVLSQIVQLVRSEIQKSNSKCLVSGRGITLGYRPGFVNAMQYLDLARTSGFGLSLLRHYLKYEEPLLRYILSNMSTEQGCYLAPFPCIYHEKQREWGRFDGTRHSNNMLNNIPTLNRLKKLLDDGFLQTGKVNVLSDDIINQVLWLVLSNRVYLSPTTVPNSDAIFGNKAKLYAFLSVDKSFEEQYEKKKIERQSQDKEDVREKISLLYPQTHENLCPSLTSPRTNLQHYFRFVDTKTPVTPDVLEYGLIIKYLGKERTSSWEQKYGETVNPELVVPRLLIWYDKKAKEPELAITSPDVISWCDQYRDAQY